MVLTHGPVIRRHAQRTEGADQSEGGSTPVNEFIRPLSPDSHQDDEPTSLAELSIVLELAPGATVGELVRSLATAILITRGDRISAGRRGKSPEDPSGPLHPPGS
jgi:hypothetical protein